MFIKPYNICSKEGTVVLLELRMSDIIIIIKIMMHFHKSSKQSLVSKSMSSLFLLLLSKSHGCLQLRLTQHFLLPLGSPP